MDFSLSSAQITLQERAREAVARVVEPVAAELTRGEKLSAEQLRRIYRGLSPLGYLGSTIPKSADGAGMSYVDYGLLLEAFGASPVFLGEIVAPRSIFHLGNSEQKARWLPKLLAGDFVSTAAITEPQAGSDIRNLRTTAVRDGDIFLLNGRKKWIKLGGISDLLTVLIVADPAKGAAGGTSRLVVERSVSPWRSREIEAVGIRNLSFVEIEFDNLLVPAGNLLGEAGEGTEAFYRAIEASRAIVGLQAIGIARHGFDIAVRYTRERRAFGRPLAKFQAIQNLLAEAGAEMEAARLLCLQALWLLDQGKRCPREASMAKLLATETAVRVCHAAMDVMGAFGLAEEAGVERCWRDCRMLTVIDGTSGIQKLVIGREILGHAAFV
jgi:alkylation response protein AidB-like acyl-CoA dehydrogenase